MFCWSLFWSAMSEWRIAPLWCCVGRYFDLIWMNDVLHSCDAVLVDILIWYEWMTYCTVVMLCWSIFWSAMSEWRSALLWCCVGRYFDLLWVNDVLYSCDVMLVDILICCEWMTYCTPVMLCWSIFWSAMSEWRSALLLCCVCQYFDLLLVNGVVHSCDVVLVNMLICYEWMT